MIALGTTVAYFYSVTVLFFPEVLPVKVAEREVYFEVSAVIIAFVLLGQYMEEIIKKRSSAAMRKLLDLKPATACVYQILAGRRIKGLHPVPLTRRDVYRQPVKPGGGA